MHKNNCRVDANLLPLQKGTRARNPPLIFHELINTSCINAPSVLNVMETMLEISTLNSPLKCIACNFQMRMSLCATHNLRKKNVLFVCGLLAVQQILSKIVRFGFKVVKLKTAGQHFILGILNTLQRQLTLIC